jgi:ABC-2 type transport system ATP-binding protein
MLHANCLKRRFGDIQAVDDISFSIAEGESLGLLGPNGAGKSTTIGMLIGLITPDSGQVELEGYGSPQSPEVRRVMGIAPQSISLYDMFTAIENLTFFCRLYGLSAAKTSERIEWALDFSGLEDRKKSRLETFSGGMKRRLNLACALLHEPRFVLLDEPTAGVDPQSRNHIFDCIDILKSNRTSILYTTHYMEEAERLCDRVAVMDHGQILALDSVSALIDQHGGEAVVTAEPRHPIPETAKLPCDLKDWKLTFQSKKPLDDVAALVSSGVQLDSLNVARPTLETVFLNLTGRSLRD